MAVEALKLAVAEASSKFQNDDGRGGGAVGGLASVNGASVGTAALPPASPVVSSCAELAGRRRKDSSRKRWPTQR